jgi:hypothetical protein
VGRLEAVKARRRHVNAELDALRASVALVRDSVLGDSSGSSSLAASLAKVGTRFMLVAVLSHFPELEPELELLGSGWDANTTSNQANVLGLWWAWPRTR